MPLTINYKVNEKKKRYRSINYNPKSNKCFSGEQCLNTKYEFWSSNIEGKRWEMRRSGEGKKKMLRPDSEAPH